MNVGSIKQKGLGMQGQSQSDQPSRIGRVEGGSSRLGPGLLLKSRKSNTCSRCFGWQLWHRALAEG